MSVIDNIEYSVCQDCFLYIAHSGEECDDGSYAHVGEAIVRERNGRPGHFNTGVAQTDEDPDGNGYEEFSRQDCELCRSTLGGSRHGVTLLLTDEA